MPDPKPASPLDPKLAPAPEQPTPGAEFDRMLHNWQGRFTGGRSPSTVGLAMLDWAAHAANAPFRTAELLQASFTQWQRLAHAAAGGPPAIAPQPGDRRFEDQAWRRRPYDVLSQAVLLGEEWWGKLVQEPDGINPQNRRIVAFTVRQFLDLASPSNVAWLNPQVIEATRASSGANLAAGMRNFLRDQAATPGKVVFRNTLMELIQYAPTTEAVGAEPVLVVPAWIMKHYILDLSPGNSLIRWLVGQGRTVFAVSWRNSGAEMGDASLDNYRTLGVMAALDAVGAVCGGTRVHATGYCLGGTLLAIAAAPMARDGDDRLASLSLFAAQTDFTEAGELQLLITDDQLDFLGDIVRTQGFLSSAQMGGAFQMLRSNDLVWTHAVNDYLLGGQDKPTDLMTWNADGTRLPAQMHMEYLRGLFLDNDLAEGRLQVDGRPLELGDTRLPMFVVGTERDHIAPWHSVFKLHQLNDQALTFSGHNAGIVSEPGHLHRHYRIRTRAAGGRTRGWEEWEQETPPQDESWWPEWAAWLARHSGAQAPPPPMGLPGHPPLCDAPGAYILEE